MAWADLADARAHWPDAPADDTTLQRLLDVATDVLGAYAPPPGDPVPTRYALACVLQARELWGAARREGDVLGFDTYAVRVRPLTGTVRALLRPTRGVPTVG